MHIVRVAVPDRIVLHIALHRVPSLPSAHHPVVLEGGAAGAETLAVEAGEDGFGAILVHRHRPAGLTVGLTVDRPQKLHHVDPAAFQHVGRGGNACPTLPEGAEGCDQFVHLRPETAGMADADGRSANHPHDRHVLADITVEAEGGMERPAVIARVDDDAGEDAVGGSEHILPLFLRRLDGHIVTLMEMALDVGHPVKRGARGLH